MRPLDEFEREQAILLDLEVSGRVMVNELTERFGVSAVTIRKDLGALERRDLLLRVRGGAVSSGHTDEGAWTMRVRHSRQAKRAVARAAAELVGHGDVIALDSSTTCYHLALELVTRRNLVVITNGLRTATLLMEQTNAMVLLPGGVLRRAAESLVGPIGDLLTGRGRIQKGFFGLVGLSPKNGLMDISAEESQTKAFMAGVCDQVYGVFDSSKAERFALHPFVTADRVTGLYTDEGVPAHVVADWAEVGVPVHRAALSSGVGEPADLELEAGSRRTGRSPEAGAQ
jgi:DeoR family transcriptional regulator of aga operon